MGGSVRVVVSCPVGWLAMLKKDEGLFGMGIWFFMGLDWMDNARNTYYLTCYFFMFGVL